MSKSDTVCMIIVILVSHPCNVCTDHTIELMQHLTDVM